VSGALSTINFEIIAVISLLLACPSFVLIGLLVF
jgi:hypothetical protein